MKQKRQNPRSNRSRIPMSVIRQNVIQTMESASSFTLFLTMIALANLMVHLLTYSLALTGVVVVGCLVGKILSLPIRLTKPWRQIVKKG